jgi:hypothetical protein
MRPLPSKSEVLEVLGDGHEWVTMEQGSGLAALPELGVIVTSNNSQGELTVYKDSGSGTCLDVVCKARGFRFQDVARPWRPWRVVASGGLAFTSSRLLLGTEAGTGTVHILDFAVWRRD